MPCANCKFYHGGHNCGCNLKCNGPCDCGMTHADCRSKLGGCGCGGAPKVETFQGNEPFICDAVNTVDDWVSGAGSSASHLVSDVGTTAGSLVSGTGELISDVGSSASEFAGRTKAKVSSWSLADILLWVLVGVVVYYLFFADDGWHWGSSSGSGSSRNMTRGNARMGALTRTAASTPATPSVNSTLSPRGVPAMNRAPVVGQGRTL